MVKKILVTGSNGQLGQEFKALQKAFPDFKFYFLTRGDLDISNREEVARVFNNIAPHFCINCAAFTGVDAAEKEAQKSFAINATGAENLALASKGSNTKLIHFSTDYVFNGTAKMPYKEDSERAPLGIYGASKAKGEELVLDALPESIVIRTSWVYSVFGNNFVKTMVRLMSERDQLAVVADQQGSPTYAADLAEATMHIIKAQNWVGGIYHYSNDGAINWFQFASAIKELTGATCTINPIATAQYPTPAARPAYSVLAKEKIVATYGIQLLPWRESLQVCLARLTAATPF